MFQGASGFHQVALELRDAAAAALDSSPGGRPGRVAVVPGAIAWDDCDCAGGQLAVSVGRSYRTTSFPTETAAAAPCGGLLVSALLVQIIRCAPQPPEGELVPEVAELEATAEVVTADAYLVRQGVTCRLAGLDDAGQVADYLVGAEPVLGPEGGCVGSELVALVALPDICCPEG